MHRDWQRSVWFAALSGLTGFSCADTGHGPEDWARPSEMTRPSAGTLAESAGARAVLDSIHTRFRWAERSWRGPAQEPRSDSPPVLLPSAAYRIELDGAWLRPHLPDALVQRNVSRAAVALPARASGPFQLRDPQSGMAVEVALAGATDAPAEIAGGFVVYRRGHESGADIVHRPAGDGTEDYLSFEHPPGVQALQYELSLGERVAGLRLVSNTLELLDAGGAPRLRMAPPYVVDAAGERHAATVALQGCAYDADPAAPWGRAVVAPRAQHCKVHVDWEQAGVRYPALVDPTWAATSSMAVARARHTASALPSGRIVVAGGTGNLDPYLASAELYDSATGTWSATGSMAIARYLHAASVLPNTHILVAGGTGLGGENLESAEVYDPVTGTWTHTGSMAVRRIMSTANVLPDGKILVAGGYQYFDAKIWPLKSAEVYDPVMGTWNNTGSMTIARDGHTASVLPDGKILVAGGHIYAGGSFNSAEVYDPVMGLWTLTGSMAIQRHQHAASALPNGKILVAGGGQYINSQLSMLKSAEVYDPATGTWTATGDMTAKRYLFTASVLSNDRILVVGGQQLIAGSETAETYDPTTGTWSTAGSPRSGAPSTQQACCRIETYSLQGAASILCRPTTSRALSCSN